MNSFDNIKFLFTGDLSEKIEKQLVKDETDWAMEKSAPPRTPNSVVFQSSMA